MPLKTEEAVIVNPDRFLRTLRALGKFRGRRPKATAADHSRRQRMTICDSCLLNKHKECQGECPCIHWQLAIV